MTSRFVNRTQVVVLMSVYKKDDPRHLRLSIESILNQSYANFRLLVGVDGSVGEELESELRCVRLMIKSHLFGLKRTVV